MSHLENHDPGDEHPQRAWDRGTLMSRVLDFLLAHPGRQFTPTEIAEELDSARNTIYKCLTRHEKRGRVKHHGYGRWSV